MDIGATIKKMRRKKQLCLRHVSIETGLSQSYLSSLETGARGASFETLEKIAKAFDKKLVVQFKKAKRKPEKAKTEDEILIERLEDKEFQDAVLAESAHF